MLATESHVIDHSASAMVLLDQLLQSLQASETPPPEGASVHHHAPADQRAHARHAPAALPRLLHARVRPGINVKLVDVAPTGVLFESGSRLLPHRPIHVTLASNTGEINAPGIVVRSFVHRVTADRVVYRTAVRLLRPLPISELLA